MRFLLFTISLILAALVAIYYSDLTDEDIRHAIRFDSEKLEQQTKRARKQADATVEAVNERLRACEKNTRGSALRSIRSRAAARRILPNRRKRP
jgi:transcriptional regulator NrdR family protein